MIKEIKGQRWYCCPHCHKPLFPLQEDTHIEHMPFRCKACKHDIEVNVEGKPEKEKIGEAIEMFRGECRCCKNKPVYMNPICHIASGKCATCKYAHRTMRLPQNTILQDEDNWEWDKSL